jgi:hypothetical protein
MLMSTGKEAKTWRDDAAHRLRLKLEKASPCGHRRNNEKRQNEVRATLRHATQLLVRRHGSSVKTAAVLVSGSATLTSSAAATPTGPIFFSAGSDAPDWSVL